MHMRVRELVSYGRYPYLNWKAQLKEADEIAVDDALKLLHPFMPFITEELWHELKERPANDCVIQAPWPVPQSFNQAILQEATYGFDVITEIRNTRNSKGLSPKEALKLVVKEGEVKLIQSFWPVVRKLCNLSDIHFSSEKVSGATSFVIKSTEFFIPLEGKVDVAKEREEVAKDLDYQRGFLASVNKKLDNERFVAGAPPQVIEGERKKKADAEAKIKALEERLKALEG